MLALQEHIIVPPRKRGLFSWLLVLAVMVEMLPKSCSAPGRGQPWIGPSWSSSCSSPRVHTSPVAAVIKISQTGRLEIWNQGVWKTMLSLKLLSECLSSPLQKLLVVCWSQHKYDIHCIIHYRLPQGCTCLSVSALLRVHVIMVRPMCTQYGFLLTYISIYKGPIS